MLVTYSLLVFLAASVTAKLPEGWKACKMSSPDYKDCSIKAILEAIKSVKSGNKELKVPPLDPVKVKVGEVINNEKDIKVRFYYTDVVQDGFTKFQFLDFKNDWNHMMMKVKFDEIISRGRCDVNGTMFGQPIQGKRTPYTYTWGGMTLTADMDLKKVDIGGNQHFQVEKMKISIQVEKSLYVYHNLFDGDKAKGDSLNKLLAIKSDEMTEQLSPTLSVLLENGFRDFANQILSQIPVKDIAL